MKPLPPSDRILARDALAGSRGACDALFERYFARVHAYVALRCRSVEEAEALVSAAMERAFHDLAGVARGEDLARRCLDEARAAAWLVRAHDSVTESPR